MAATIDCMAGAHRCHGTGGPDTIGVRGGIDDIYGNDVGDQIQGQDGDDILRGDVGDDTIMGGRGKVTVSASPISGGIGRIYGGPDDDSL